MPKHQQEPSGVESYEGVRRGAGMTEPKRGTHLSSGIGHRYSSSQQLHPWQWIVLACSRARDRYLVVAVDGNWCNVRKSMWITTVMRIVSYPII